MGGREVESCRLMGLKCSDSTSDAVDSLFVSIQMPLLPE